MIAFKKIVIDGYNLIHRIPELTMLMQGSAGLAREQLLLKLVNYRNLQTKSIDITVVFDGHYAGDHPGRQHIVTDDIRQIYTAMGESADEAIKRELEQHDFPEHWLVVTSDYWDINSVIQQAGGRFLPSEQFAQWLDRAVEDALPPEKKIEVTADEWKGNRAAGFKVYKSWVTVNCPFQLASVYIIAKGEYEIDPESVPDGFQLDQNGAALTIINVNGKLEAHDILFEFTGQLTITRVEVLDLNGDHQEARLTNYI